MKPAVMFLATCCAGLPGCATDYVAPASGLTATLSFAQEGKGARAPRVSVCNVDAGEWQLIGRGPQDPLAVAADRPLLILYEATFKNGHRTFSCKDYVAELDLEPGGHYELTWRAGPEFYGSGACQLQVRRRGDDALLPFRHMMSEAAACGTEG